MLANAIARGGSAEIVTCYSRRSESRNEFAARHGCRAAESLDEVLDDPEVEGVLIATAHESHRQLVEAVAAVDKHIFVEKPLANVMVDARACVAAVEAAGVLLQVGHQRRRQPANRKIREMISSGVLGDIETVTGHHSAPYGFTLPGEAWRWDPAQSPLGSMTSMGIHLIDTMHYLIGPIVRVMALTRPSQRYPVDETTVIGFEFASGTLGTLASSFFTAPINEVAVFGSDAAAYNRQDGRFLTVHHRSNDRQEQIEMEPFDLLVDQLDEFAGAIRGERSIEVDGRAGMAVVAVLDAAVESVTSGRSVDVSRV